MYKLEGLQKAQLSAARLILQSLKRNHISPLLTSLQWLPNKARIDHRLTVICNSVFIGLSPLYLSDLLSVCTPKRDLRFSSDNRILCIPNLRTKTFGHRSFSFAAPTIWNLMPTEQRHTDSILKFKSALKINLLRKFHA